MGESDLGHLTPACDVEADVGAGPLGGIVRERQCSIQDPPRAPFPWDEFGDLLRGDVEVAVAIGELPAQLVGRAVDVSRPPPANVCDCREGLIGSVSTDSTVVNPALVMVLCSCHELRVLTLECLAAPPYQLSARDRDRGQEDVFLAVVEAVEAVEDGASNSERRRLGDVQDAGHVGVGGSGQDGMHPRPCLASSARSDWVSDSAAALEIEYAGVRGSGARGLYDTLLTMAPCDLMSIGRNACVRA